MKTGKRFLALLLTLALMLSILPASVLAVEHDAFTLDNGYIQVKVSKVNGGFTVNTLEGNLLRKSDNNKQLLYHSGEYDTSFVSFRVGSGAEARDYLFGGKYAGASAVSVTQATEGGNIVATWSVAGITFTQTVSLDSENSSEHGMVSVALSAQNNSGAAVPIQARVLLDTCLGDQDYALYQLSGPTTTETVSTELVTEDETLIKSFYALDDLADPLITAYTVSEPTKLAIGHWNNLAASLFDFAPDTGLNFTNAVNEYLTADSACALYYDMGTVSSGASGSAVTHYGVYSNHTVNLQNRVAINTSAPLRLMLNGDKTDYVPQSNIGLADFAVTVSAENYAAADAIDFDNVIMAIRSTSGLRPLGDSGEALTGYDYETSDPHTISYGAFRVGETITKTLYFEAKPQVSANYERITIGMYKAGSSTDEVTGENLLGEKVIYILLPGSDGDIPKISFSAMTPDTVYSSGTRHLYVAVTNENILSNALASGSCSFFACSADGKTRRSIDSDNITITDGIVDVAMTEEVKLSVGSWYLQLEWTDDAVTQGLVTSDFKKQTSSALQFQVSDDPKFKNDSYGVLAAVKYKEGTGSTERYIYRLENFKDEDAFKAFSEDKNHKWVEILLVFRGEFTGDNRYTVKDENGKTIGYTYYNAVSTKKVDPATRETTVDNCITINNCVDFEGGTMSVYYENYTKGSPLAQDSAILVEFDGDLYTSDARTSVWTGKAALTKLEQGGNFSLIQYDANGVRKSTAANPITLIWPNVFSYAQTLAGMAFKLAYGQFGVMSNSEGEIGRTIAFSASLSLSFMSSPDPDPHKAPDTYFGRMKELWTDWRGASLYQYAYNGARLERLLDIGMNDDTSAHKNAEKGVGGSVMVQDILFGCGQGLVGLNFTVSVTVKNVIDGLPKLEGSLSINTINNWSFGLEAACKFTNKMKLEAKLKFKSYENIPVPDEIYFYIGGFDPGLNVDGAGVLWITGGGGGISNLYDTIFCTSGLPPLKLIITISFNIIQVLEGTAKLTLSLTGFDLTASDLTIRGVIKVIKKIQLGLQWYPDLKLTAGIYVSLFEKTIEGQGYIILLGKDYSDWFFEMYVRAALKIPESVPLVGGMALLAIDLGVSTKKIWGAFEALCICVGVSYYWGEDHVNFGSGKDKASPTYPNLLLSGYDGECEDFPVAYDEENDRYLYAHIGTNFEAPRSAQVLSGDALRLMDASGVWSDEGRTTHKFNLGDYAANSNEATAVQLTFPAGSLAEAQTLARSFTVTDAQSGGTAFPITWTRPVPAMGEEETAEEYEQRVGSIVEANKSANANVTFNSDTGTATFGFTVTDASQFKKDWWISTGATPAEVVLYNVLPVPAVTAVSGSVQDADPTDKYLELSWSGTNMDGLQDISFFLAGTKDPAEDPGYRLKPENNYFYVGGGQTSCFFPEDLPTGDYYLRAVYSAEDLVNGVVYSDSTLHIENSNTPAAMAAPTVSPAGDLKFGVTIPESSDPNTAGYMVSVLNADGTDTDITDLTFDKAETGPTSFEIGGTYAAPVKAETDNPDAASSGSATFGLTGGESYILSITPYRTVDTNGDGEDDAIICGQETRTATAPLPMAVTPTANLSARGKALPAMQDLDSGTASPTYTENALNVEAAFSEAVSGTWILDDGEAWDKMDTDTSVVSGSFTNVSSTVFALSGLAEGDHLLTVIGFAADGDRFSYSYPFTVDTTAPRLILSSPMNGSPFAADGTLTVSGVTDADATLTYSIDGGLEQELRFTRTTDGVFTATAPIPNYNDADTHDFRLVAVDPNGNRTEPVEVTVMHPGLGTLSDIVLMADKTVYTDGVLSTAVAAEGIPLSVVGVTAAGTFSMDPDRVSWRSFAADGTIEVDSRGYLSYSADSKGFVEAMVEVSQGAYRRASLALNAGLADNVVSVFATVGGSTTGAGDYTSGNTVTLTATAENGYRFDHWELTGVAVSDTASATISFTMPDTAVTARAVFVTLFLPGDLNGDGNVNALDLVRMRNYLLGRNVVLKASGDLNGDGIVNAMDLLRLKKYLLGESVELH